MGELCLVENNNNKSKIFSSADLQNYCAQATFDSGDRYQSKQNK